MNLDFYYNYDELAEDFYSAFGEEFGRIKLEEISSKIDSSKAVERLVQDSIKFGELPNQATLSAVLLGTRHFMFAKSRTLNFACFLALNKVIGAFQERGLFISSERCLEILKRIIQARN